MSLSSHYHLSKSLPETLNLYREQMVRDLVSSGWSLSEACSVAEHEVCKLLSSQQDFPNSAPNFPAIKEQARGEIGRYEKVMQSAMDSFVGGYDSVQVVDERVFSHPLQSFAAPPAFVPKWIQFRSAK